MSKYTLFLENSEKLQRNFKKLFHNYFDSFKANYKAICYKQQQRAPGKINKIQNSEEKEKSVDKSFDAGTARESKESEESELNTK